MSNTKNFNNQCERLLDHLTKNKSITTAEAVTELGINSLSRRICDLKNRGIAIKKERDSTINRYGDKVYFKRYSLEEFVEVAQ